MTKVYLTGYEGETLGEFLSKVKTNNIQVLIDVREIPLSRKRGFSKTALSEALAEEGIAYYHLGCLGSPTEIRNQLKNTNDYPRFFREYRKYIKNQTEEIKTLTGLLNGHISLLMCYEKESDLCHRSIIASELQQNQKNLMIAPI